ncbi:MAG: magnesium transporter [Planctomycetota bacterium]|nr:MAG: magnesium transporter [Planctomycetota bacterium]
MTSEDTTNTHLESIEEQDITLQFRDQLAKGDGDTLAQWIDTLEPDAIVHAMAHLSGEEQLLILRILDPEDAADLIDDLPDEHSADLLEEIPVAEAADIVEELDSDDRADVLAEMSEDDAEAILDEMEQEEAIEARQLLSYPSDTAGGVMVKEYVAFPLGTTVEEVLNDLRGNREEYSSYNVQYFYVIDHSGKLKGVLRLRDMVLSPPQRPIDEVMIADPDVVRVDLDLQSLQRMLEIHSYSALPIVDSSDRLLGVAIEKDVAEAARKSANKTMLKLVGIFGGEELRSMPTLQRIGRRLPWLCLILILTVCAASVIPLFEEKLTPEMIVALTMFLPVVAGMSGCSGNQALGLSLRELALGIVRPWDLTYVLAKEIRVSLLNGLVLGLLLCIIGYILNGDYWLGIIVGIAIMCNTVISVCIGGVLPLIVKRLKLDPATVSSPILTMIVDASGFFLVLSLALAILRLTGIEAGVVDPP